MFSQVAKRLSAHIEYSIQHMLFYRYPLRFEEQIVYSNRVSACFVSNNVKDFRHESFCLGLTCIWFCRSMCKFFHLCECDCCSSGLNPSLFYQAQLHSACCVSYNEKYLRLEPFCWGLICLVIYTPISHFVHFCVTVVATIQNLPFASTKKFLLLMT